MSWRAAGALCLLLACAKPAPVREPLPVAAPAVPVPERKLHPDARKANSGELALVRGLMRVTERLRGLQFRAPVEVTIEGKKAMRAYVEQAIDSEVLDRAVRRYLALGAIDASLDVRALLGAVMEEELVGYYDPKQKRLAVRADIARALDTRSTNGVAWRATVVHELTHALQDQYFDLAASLERTRTTDADDAFGALVEGDATLVMLGYTAELGGESMDDVVDQPDRILAALTRSPDMLTPALRAAPALLREPLLFRYREGALFCARLYRKGGWTRVDHAQRNPPQTTRVIRKPDAYLDDAAELGIGLPRIPLAGWTERDEDVLGALELTVMLGLDAPTAARVIEDWRGDRYRVYARGEELASFWLIELASRASARTVAAGLTRLGDKKRKVVLEDQRVLVARGLDATAVAAALELVRHARTQRGHGDPLATSAGQH